MIVKTTYIEFTHNLDKEKQMLFGLLAAERFINCYKLFSQKEDFGDIVCIIEANKLIERKIFREEYNAVDVSRLIKLVEENTPDMDDFGSVCSSLALNVSAIVYESLNMIENFEERRMETVSTFCTDTIDFLVLEIEGYNRMDLKAVEEHELMKEEILLQKSIVKYLEKIPVVEEIDLETLRSMQANRKFDLLNLENILYAE